MTFLAPLFFVLGLGVAAAAVAFHFIVTRQPPSSPLPTARFVPEGSVRVTTVAAPTDRWLLALRALLALVIGAAFAGPILVPKRRPVARVVAADVSRAVGAVGGIEAVRDSARALLHEGDVLVVFDSAAHVVRHGAADSAAALARSPRPGRLSVALLAALRSATAIRRTADSLELVVISPFRATELDGATAALRQLWPGRIRLVRVPPAADSMAPAVGFTVQAPADDPVGLAATRNAASLRAAPQSAAPSNAAPSSAIPSSAIPPRATTAAPRVVSPEGQDQASQAAVRIVRGPLTSADSLWASAGPHTLVRWPAEGAPPGWVARRAADTVGAVVAGAVGAGPMGTEPTALVVPLERRWQLAPAARPARVVARWVDGAPAAVESVVGNGCIRDVAIPVPTRGDVMLRPSFARLLEALGTPCEATRSGAGIAERDLDAFGGSGPLAAAVRIAPPDTTATPLVPWLFGLALLLAIAELLVRRYRRRPTSGGSTP